ncbi:hypothetical protein ACQKAZ_04140 [Helicobacter pylori]
MFASDVVIIFIIFFGVSFILFGKEKNVKKDSKILKILDIILDIIMNIIIFITVIAIFFPWVLMLLFYVFGFLALHVIPY